MSGSVLCLGAGMVDITLAVPALPVRGGDLPAQAVHVSVGGCALNAATAVRRLGGRVRFAGRIGSGPLADLVRAAVAAEDIELVSWPPAPRDSGICVALVEPDGERTFVSCAGAEADLSGEHLDGLSLEGVTWLYIAGYELATEPAGAAITAWLDRLPRPPAVLFDPGPPVATIPADRLRAVLRRTDILALNHTEAAALLQRMEGSTCDAPLQLAAALAERLAPAVVLRLGAGGCVVAQRGARPVAVPAYPVDAVDTSGAGDAHSGGLLAGLAAGWSLLDAARLANAVAALTVTRWGARTAPDRRQLAALDPALAAALPEAWG